MYYSFKEIHIWPSRNMVNHFMPSVIREQYGSTREIIDATEFPIENPANPDVQAATWSNYIERNTLKLLVGTTPNGVVTFLSPLYGGRVSDKELTRRSGLLNLLEKGDSIMADAGFVAAMLPEGVDLDIPPV